MHRAPGQGRRSRPRGPCSRCCRFRPLSRPRRPPLCPGSRQAAAPMAIIKLYPIQSSNTHQPDLSQRAHGGPSPLPAASNDPPIRARPRIPPQTLAAPCSSAWPAGEQAHAAAGLQRCRDAALARAARRSAARPPPQRAPAPRPLPAARPCSASSRRKPSGGTVRGLGPRARPQQRPARRAAPPHRGSSGRPPLPPLRFQVLSAPTLDAMQPLISQAS